MIADQQQLRQHHEQWMESSNRWIKTLFSPYTNGYLRAACSRGWLPSFLSKKKTAMIYNYLNCEAHRDRLLHYFKRL